MLKKGLLKITITQNQGHPGGGIRTMYKRIHEVDLGVKFTFVADEKTEFIPDGSDTPNISNYTLQNNTQIFNGNDYNNIASYYVIMGELIGWSWIEPLTEITA